VTFEERGADLPLSGTSSGEARSVSFIVGYRWRKGFLKLNDGQEFPFTVRGLKVVKTGARVIDFAGEVDNSLGGATVIRFF